MPHRILHLSDTHAGATGRDQHDVDALAALDGLLHDCRHLPNLDLVLVTGDVADDGSAEGCAAVRERVGSFAASRGIPHVYTTGNHDRRPGFTLALGTGHLDDSGADVGVMLDGLDGPGGSEGERAAVSMVGGLRVVTLDSLVPGAVHGVVSRRQLSALRGLLRDPAPAGTVLALHHPPIHTQSAPWMRPGGLHNRDELAEVIAGTDVVAVLCGHFHLQLGGQLAGVPVWVTPGVVTRIDLTAASDVVRAVRGAGATVVDLGGPFSPSFHVLHARDAEVGQQVYVADPAGFRDGSAGTGE
ncbi:metallophosphoesterase family protein [Nocardioides pantholopis]|uniref:metallophosphoesterase family protein n=1 Tax=Nocardioides pantholopis TaxID=2483798 RepID=UPI0013E3B464|nr:metallophosphoesterase [Nocardioides pantholopis]